jgi:hypothetical protein
LGSLSRYLWSGFYHVLGRVDPGLFLQVITTPQWCHFIHWMTSWQLSENSRRQNDACGQILGIKAFNEQTIEPLAKLTDFCNHRPKQKPNQSKKKKTKPNRTTAQTSKQHVTPPPAAAATATATPLWRHCYGCYRSRSSSW